MSLADIVEVATDAIERPDYTLEAAYVRGLLKSSLNYLHALRNFDQDLEDLVEPLAPIGSSITIPLPADYRQLHGLTMLDSSGNPIPKEFKRGRAHRKPSDNFGFEYPNYYYLLGQEVRIWWQMPLSQQGSMVLTYYKLPTLVLDSQTNEWTTDSWIAARWPNVVSAELAKRLGGNTESSQYGILSQQADMDTYSMLNDLGEQGG